MPRKTSYLVCEPCGEDRQAAFCHNGQCQTCDAIARGWRGPWGDCPMCKRKHVPIMYHHPCGHALVANDVTPACPSCHAVQDRALAMIKPMLGEIAPYDPDRLLIRLIGWGVCRIYHVLYQMRQELTEPPPDDINPDGVLVGLIVCGACLVWHIVYQSGEKANA
jgi:hypothetical protein